MSVCLPPGHSAHVHQEDAVSQPQEDEVGCRYILHGRCHCFVTMVLHVLRTVGVITISWIMCLKMSRIRRQLKVTRAKQLESNQQRGRVSSTR